MSNDLLPEPWARRPPEEEGPDREAALLLRRALAEQPEVDPAAGARARAALAARLDHAPRGRRRVVGPVRWGAAAAALAAAVLLARLPSRDAGPTPVARVLAGTVVAYDDGQPRPVPVGERTAAGTRLGCADRCRIEVTEGIEVSLAEDTVLSVGGPDQTEVHAGEAGFTVEPLPPGERFVVFTGATVVEVVGTAFTVRAADAGAARVEVSEGIVRVTHRGVMRLVKAGERWVAPLSRRRAASEQEAQAQPAPSSASSSAPSSEEDPSGGPASATGEGGGPPEPAEGRPAPGRSKGARPDPASDAASGAAGRDAAADLIERAAALVTQGKLTEARGLYRQLADRPGASGELGLYLLAQLELEQLASPEAAQRTLAEMRRRYPAGTLAPERDLTHIETLLAQGRCADARSAMARFRTDHPGAAQMLAGAESALATGPCGG